MPITQQGGGPNTGNACRSFAKLFFCKAARVVCCVYFLNLDYLLVTSNLAFHHCTRKALTLVLRPLPRNNHAVFLVCPTLIATFTCLHLVTATPLGRLFWSIQKCARQRSENVPRHVLPKVLRAKWSRPLMAHLQILKASSPSRPSGPLPDFVVDVEGARGLPRARPPNNRTTFRC